MNFQDCFFQAKTDYSDAIKILEINLRSRREEVSVLKDNNETLQKQLKALETRCKCLYSFKIIKNFAINLINLVKVDITYTSICNQHENFNVLLVYRKIISQFKVRMHPNNGNMFSVGTG